MYKRQGITIAVDINHVHALGVAARQVVDHVQLPGRARLALFIPCLLYTSRQHRISELFAEREEASVKEGKSG